jgi:hypothetical protein
MSTIHTLFLVAQAVLGAEQQPEPSLRDSLTFHASYDATADADLAKGDRRAHTSPSGDPVKGTPGMSTADIRLEKSGGRHGGALRFVNKTKTRFYYRGARNIHYAKKSWSGTVSFWLRLDPDKDLAPGFCDPIQITDKTWNKSALWVDFSKELPRTFRFGAYADFKIWNPENKKYDDIPESQRPMVVVKKPPFSRDRWTHVVLTYSKFNTSGTRGVANLYLDGKLRGAVEKHRQVFTWTPEKVAIMVGISYVGWFDDLALFDRALTAAEIKRLHALPGGVTDLTKEAGASDRKQGQRKKDQQ